MKAAFQDARRESNKLYQYRSSTPSIINYDDDIGGNWGNPHQANGVVNAGKGPDSYAQRLANETGKTVKAPTQTIWIDKKGGFSVYDVKRDNQGNPIKGPNGYEKNLKVPGVMKSFTPADKKNNGQ